jgi:hypothetical protein
MAFLGAAILGIGCLLGWCASYAFSRHQRQQVQATLAQLYAERDALSRSEEQHQLALLLQDDILRDVMGATDALEDALVLLHVQLSETRAENQRLRGYLERALFVLARAPEPPRPAVHGVQRTYRD